MATRAQAPHQVPGAALAPEVLRWRGERLRVTAFRDRIATAQLGIVADAPAPSAAFVRRCTEQLAERGVTHVVTTALSPAEQRGFLAAGWGVRERLHLLEADLGELPPLPPGPPLVRVGRRRRDEVLAVDHLAFAPFWRFDRQALADAVAATPRSRVRAAVGDDGAVCGYAVCGRADARGFVQRLAVTPERQGAGTGRRLLLDGLHWLARRGARRAVVNTQVGNDRALSLYVATGFVDDGVGLAVLEHPVGAGG